MSNVGLVIAREYGTRVRKRSFLIMTIVGPLLFAGVIGAVVWLSVTTRSQKEVVILDESGLFGDYFKSSGDLVFTFVTDPLPEAQARLLNGDFDALLYLPPDVVDQPAGATLFSPENVGLDLRTSLERRLRERIENLKLLDLGINRQTLNQIETKVDLTTKKLSDAGEEDANSGAASLAALFGAFLIYFFIFLYGVQIMRGVMEEKTSRIIEVIVSAVKPFDLMFGKIIGIALVGLTQFLLWVALTSLLSAGIALLAGGSVSPDAPPPTLTEVTQEPNAVAAVADRQAAVEQLMAAVGSVNLPYLLAVFVFYFIGGYLLYGALFAAVGSAVDSDTDTQQFMFPITIPLIASIIVAQVVLRDPSSPLALWMSFIPFTSPIIMMVRLPFGVPGWELALSMGLLVLGFVGTTWLAGRIYRVGILLYGKKVNYRELGRWLFYR